MSASFFRSTSEGWKTPNALECANCNYMDWVAKWWAGEGQQQAALESDRAAAARAVVRIRLTKL